MPVKLQSDAPTEWRRWISCPADEAARPVRLLCLPHAGSGAAGFMRWRRLLAKPWSVCPVLLSGRETRMSEPASTDAGLVVEAVFGAMAAGDLTASPYVLFGHSMGALLAYELACRIARAELPPPLRLIVSGRSAPQLPFAHRGLHRLGDDGFLAGLQHRYGGLDALLEDAELREVFLPVLRADLALVETYHWAPRPRLTCAVEALAGADDESVDAGGLAGWAELTAGRFTSARLRGSHFFHFAAGQAELLRRISAIDLAAV